MDFMEYVITFYDIQNVWNMPLKLTVGDPYLNNAKLESYTIQVN